MRCCGVADEMIGPRPSSVRARFSLDRSVAPVERSGIGSITTWGGQQLKTDPSTLGYKIDFGRLHEFAGGPSGEIGRAILYGSRPPANDSLWNMARRKGFEVIVHERNASNREKKI